MTIEEELKAFILEKYPSVREFTIQNHIPYSTIATIFKRGINNSSYSSIFKICDALDISADELADGKIIPRNESISWQDKKLFDLYKQDRSVFDLDESEIKIIRAYRTLNDNGKDAVLAHLEIVLGNPSMTALNPPSTAKKAT